MQDTSLNVGAVGIYYDGNTWWATFIAMIDNTPPGAQKVSAPPTKTAAPVAREQSPTGVPQPAAEGVGADVPSGNGDTPEASDEAATAPGAEEDLATPVPAGREVYVISGPVEIAGIDPEETERVPATAAVELRGGYQEGAASAAAILLGSSVALLRLKRRSFKPRKVKRIVRKLGKDGPAPIRTALPHSGRRERAAGARRQPELARG
jgi:hypothetical protein